MFTNSLAPQHPRHRSDLTAHINVYLQRVATTKQRFDCARCRLLPVREIAQLVAPTGHQSIVVSGYMKVNALRALITVDFFQAVEPNTNVQFDIRVSPFYMNDIQIRHAELHDVVQVGF